MIGTRVGPFTIVYLLDERGTARLYLAEHAALGTWYLVKVVAPQVAEPAQLAGRAVHQASAATEPHDRNLLQVHDVGQLANGAWFRMLDEMEVAHASETGYVDPAPCPEIAPTSAREPASGAGSRYQLGDKLGSGGMAEVFAGTMIGVEGFARQVAIKRVLTGLSQVPAFAAMFVAEAQIASRLAHPNIVSVLDFSRDPEDRLFLVMEYVDGKNLASLLDAGPIPPSIALVIVVELLRGLGYAHDLPDPLGGSGGDASAPRGVIHRDVSPQNVLLSYEGAVKVSDFGLAKVRDASGGVCSETVRGKPSYMSPEQIAGEPLDGRTDLYAVGVMLWEMLARRPLFAGTMREIQGQVMFRDIAAPSSLRGDVPADLEAIAMKLLARKRDDRYPTAEAAIEALLRCDAVPRDGRGDLSHLLAERFPRASGSRLQRRTDAVPTGGPRAPRAEQITLPEPPSVPVLERATGAISPIRAGDRATSPAIRAIAGLRVGVFAATLSGAAIIAAIALVISRGEVAQSGTTDRAAAPRRGVLASASALRPAPASAPSVPLAAPASVPSVPLAVAPSAPSLPSSEASSVPLAVAPSVPSVPSVPSAVASVSPSVSPSVAGARGELPPLGARTDAAQAPELGAAARTGERAPPRLVSVHRDRRRAARTGELAIIVKPWAMIWLNGKPSGQTPFRAPVPAGRYRVQLVNDDIAHHEITTVTVEPDQTATVERSW